MGVVMPPELGSALPLQPSHVHSNGNSAKLGGISHATDVSLAPGCGVSHENESEGKLHGIPELEGATVEGGRVIELVGPGANDGIVASEDDSPHRFVIEENHTQGPESAIAESEIVADSESESVASELKSNVTGGETNALHGNSDVSTPVPDRSSGWESAAGHAGWEVVEGSVLGPGSSVDEKTPDCKPASAKELYTYYMVKFPKAPENKFKTEIRMAELRVKEKTEKRDFINAAVQLKRASRSELLDKLRASRDKERACKDSVRSKMQEIEPLQTALRKIRDAGRVARDKNRDLPSSEAELDDRIAYLEYRIQHESIPLREEKQLLRDIKNLKASREEVCANAALHAELYETLGQREDIQERLKPLVSELEALKLEQTIATEKRAAIEAEFGKVDEAFNQLQADLVATHRVRDNAVKDRFSLQRQDHMQNDEFYQNHREINRARSYAYKNDRKMVEEICNAQVERILEVWNNDPVFRAAYIKNNERSTLKRLQTFDGRSLGPDEEPPFIPTSNDETVLETQAEVNSKLPNLWKESTPSKGTHKAAEIKVALANAPSVSEKKEREAESSSSAKSSVNGIPSSIILSAKDTSQENDEKAEEAELAAAAELKEKRRQQEMAKAKEAEERKRRLAERSQSKALARAHKDAERREKEKEKKARKKAALSSASLSTPTADMVSEEGQGVQEPKSAAETPVQELPVEKKSISSSRQRKRSSTQKIKSSKTPFVSTVSKKAGLGTQTWMYIFAGSILLVVIFVFLIRFIGIYKRSAMGQHSSKAEY